jgi:hypothetical protein
MLRRSAGADSQSPRRAIAPINGVRPGQRDRDATRHAPEPTVIPSQHRGPERQGSARSAGYRDGHTLMTAEAVVLGPFEGPVLTPSHLAALSPVARRPALGTRRAPSGPRRDRLYLPIQPQVW